MIFTECMPRTWWKPFCLALLVLALPISGTEPALIWQQELPGGGGAENWGLCPAVRQVDGSILIVTFDETNVSPRIVSPDGKIVARSEIPLLRSPVGCLPDPWGGVTIQGGLCETCEEELMKYDARTGRPRWDSGFPATPGGVLGVSPAGDVLVHVSGPKIVMLDGVTGLERWRSDVLSGYRSPQPTTKAVIGTRLVAGAPEIVALSTADGSEIWKTPVIGHAWAGGPWQTARDGYDVLIATPNASGILVSAFDLETGGLRWGPVQLARGSLPTPLFELVLEQGGDGSVAVAAGYQESQGNPLQDVGIWRIDGSGGVAWGPVIHRSPAGPNSSDRIGDVRLSDSGDVFFSGFRRADRAGTGSTSRGFLTRFAAEDGHVRWEVPRTDVDAFSYQYFDILPDPAGSLDVIGSALRDEAGVRLFHFSSDNGSLLRPRLAVDGRNLTGGGPATFWADANRLRLATSDLRRTDLTMSTGEIESGPRDSRSSGARNQVVTAEGDVITAYVAYDTTLRVSRTSSDLALKWATTVPAFQFTDRMNVIVTEGEVVISLSGSTQSLVVALSVASGEVLWGPRGFPVRRAALLATDGGDVVFSLAVGTSQTRLQRIRAATGAVLWDQLTGPLTEADGVGYSLALAADAWGLSIAWSSSGGVFVERRNLETGAVLFGPFLQPGEKAFVLACANRQTYLAVMPDRRDANILYRFDEMGQVVWLKPMQPGTVAKVVADDRNVHYLYWGPGTSFISANRVVDGAQAGSPIRVGPNDHGFFDVWSEMRLVPGAGLLVVVPDTYGHVVSRIDETLAFGPANGLLASVLCGRPVDIDLGIRNEQGPLVLEFVSPASERPPGVVLSPAGRLVGTPLRVGTFVFRVRVSDGQQSSEKRLTLDVRSDVPPMRVTRSPTDAQCPGSPVTLHAEPGYASYVWSSGQTGPTITVLPTVSTSYSVVARDASGCEAQGLIPVRVRSLAPPFLSAPPSASPGDVLDVVVEGGTGHAFSWTVENGELLAGQNTGQVRVRAGVSGVMNVWASRLGATCSNSGRARVVVRKPTGLYVVEPCRIVDTRLPDGMNGGPSLDPFDPSVVTLVGHCGIPATATAIVINMTFIPSDRVDGAGLCADDLDRCSPFLDGRGGRTRTTAAILRLPADGSGRFVARSSGGGPGGHLIVDVSGYFE